MFKNESAQAFSSNEELAPVSEVKKKLRVSTMHRAGGAVKAGSLDEYSNGSKSGKATTFSDQSGNKATGIKDSAL